MSTLLNGEWFFDVIGICGDNWGSKYFLRVFNGIANDHITFTNTVLFDRLWIDNQ